jgi:hypothetical protein
MRYVTLNTEEIKALEELYESALDNSTRKRWIIRTKLTPWLPVRN